MSTTGKYFIITGASTGLGKELSWALAKQKRNLILVALPESGLSELQKQIQKSFEIDVQIFEKDLTESEQIFDFYEEVKSNFLVEGLINNAGVGGSKLIDDSTIEYIDKIVLLNVRATSLLTRLFIPELKKNEKSYIMNIASMAAYSPIPYKTVYPASKAFVYYFSKGLRHELKHCGVNVCVVNPGPIATNPEVVNRIKSLGVWGKIGLVSAECIARKSVSALLKGKGVVIPGMLNKTNLLLIRIVPSFIRLPIMSAIFKKEFKKAAD